MGAVDTAGLLRFVGGRRSVDRMATQQGLGAGGRVRRRSAAQAAPLSPDIVKRAFELADAEAAVREADLQDFKLADLAIRTPPQFRVIDPHDKAHANRSPVAVRIAVAIVD